ncbi:putative ribonuclease H-like domain-containing protein [Tanacetum coccineum]|uniref:Ribonuclease H-like domain-containing protein n=1 Tax=Tanacetum coccineum TaxID=301880 RepID=A0ABQ5GJ47_9ASTR
MEPSKMPFLRYSPFELVSKYRRKRARHWNIFLVTKLLVDDLLNQQQDIVVALAICTKDIINAGDSEKEDESAQDCFVLPIWPSYSSTITLALKTNEKREEELLQFKIQKVWFLVRFAYGRKAIGHMQEEGIDYAEMSSMGELTFFLGLQVKQKADGIFISQDKYVAEILKKFDFANVKTASTPIETQKPLVKDEEASDVDVHLYRSMIGSLMYLTASRPDIMFAVCACSRFQVTPKSSYLSAVKRIFRRLISWQCKKQTIVATSTTEAEYVAAASCCGQVLWIQNQMLDYGFNFMNTKIYIDNESTICIGQSPLYFASMLVQKPTEEEVLPSEIPSEAQPQPSPAPTIAQIKKLKKQAKPVLKHHRAWLQSVSLKQRLARKRSSKKHWVHKESVSKQGRKPAKGKPSVHRDPLFDDIPEDTVDHMETENAQYGEDKRYSG